MATSLVLANPRKRRRRAAPRAKTMPVVISGVATYVGMRMAGRLIEKHGPENLRANRLVTDGVPGLAAAGAWYYLRRKKPSLALGVAAGATVRGAECLLDYVAIKTGTDLVGLGRVSVAAPTYRFPALGRSGDPLDVPDYQSSRVAVV